MAFIEQIYHLNLWYLPIITFILVLVLGIVIGVWNGWKTSLFFLGWHISIMLIVLFAGNVIILQNLDGIINLFQIPQEVGDVIKDNSNAFIDICLLIILVLALLIIDFFAFWIYLIFRKKLKRSIKETRELGGSNKISRSIGGTIGFVSAFPMAIAATGLATTLNTNVKVSSAFSEIVKYGTFNKVENIYDDTRSLLSMLSTIDPLRVVVGSFDDIDGGISIDDIKEASPEQKKDNTNKLEEILSLNTATLLIKNYVKEQITQTIALDQSKIDLASEIFLTQFEHLTLNTKQKNNLFKILDSIFPAQETQVNNLIEQISL